MPGGGGVTTRRELVSRLAAICGAPNVVWRREDLLVYEYDGTIERKQPYAVVFPADAEETAAVVRVCNELGMPVTPRGAGTGLSGGSVPTRRGVVIGTSRMRRILEIDAANRIAVVEPGLPNIQLSEAAATHGLFYAPDPSSQKACTIGGNVAENSGGVHCLKYGLTLHNVLRVRGFSVEGEPVVFGSDALDVPGLDLLPLVVGSEGMLAVITEVTVRLVPKPQLARCVMAMRGISPQLVVGKWASELCGRPTIDHLHRRDSPQ